ncbi:NAD-dependent malic enzyme [Candidatus Falkowbacteria bacterium CG_4_10_14_0_2_um_filter_48_10]|uniref:NAD-dependent malic enzyme n=1 Tax=Candidatus Falkowbacteria bacterium CG23_combo_of_CG06-09_8_20_14_all_49_15 TaxID=1974572 RepID=A0A2G9ZM08_9BACT|nr:MAG: NAD-dependent malic enzyme [Candidatus Falkowbacteria bacterium CG23_combo_of_CG06-09_8_20_14_all_49_15]PJA07568.1 MAG: NAD-dependent malic enzyme [Candidatus Falkowbacteria bacterium CG_4_10_14_0_2_um_filter_48_10]
MDNNQASINLHRRRRGKIAIQPKVRLKTRQDLSLAYSPGVGAVSLAIAKNPEESWQLTNRANQIAIVSDGTAILGLGDIGPEAGMPVMEGKAVIFKEFAGIDAFPLCIKAKEVDEIVLFCRQLEPSFAGINLEDISAPRCFAILERLEKELNIPVFHDDQDGTAIVVLAALINAGRVLKKPIKKAKIVINGAGAAGLAIARLLLAYGVSDISLADTRGAIYHGRPDLNPYKKALAEKTNQQGQKGELAALLVKADVFIGVSQAGALQPDMIKKMNPKPIIFAMANPVPEIMPAEAHQAGAGLVGTGRSDFPNQINNALVFPGLFRGLLDKRIKIVSLKMKLAAALAIAKSVKPTLSNILPNITNKNIVKIIANAIKRA